MTSTENEFNAHPNPMDRNRSITWARYHMDSDDWVLFALKVTRKRDQAGIERPSLVTYALMNQSGETILEGMVKASDMVSNEEIAYHGVDYSVVYNAVPYQQAIEQLRAKIDGKSIVSWDVDRLQREFRELDELYGLVPQRWSAHSAQKEFARYTGQTKDVKNGYDLQPLAVLGLSAVDELKAVKRVMSEMAASSQASDSIVSGKPGWTAEFYRPRANPGDKLKGFFGLKN